MLTVLSGGTGSVKLVGGFSKVTDQLVIIANTGDNFWIQGLYVCPDIDTVMYGLAGMLDGERGWGIRHDSFNFNRQLRLLGQPSWFKIGDRDLVTHVLRTEMLREGERLAEITRRLCSLYDVEEPTILPATEDKLETHVVSKGREMHLQEYWVKNHGFGPVDKITYKGAKKAKPAEGTIDAIRKSGMAVIAPGNPVSSIGPILAVKGIRDLMGQRKRKNVAVSPIIGNMPVSGPAGKYMRAAGLEVSPYGVAKFYSQVVSKFVIHTSDQKYASKIEELGLSVHRTNILMRNRKDEIRLAKYLLELDGIKD